MWPRAVHRGRSFASTVGPGLGQTHVKDSMGMSCFTLGYANDIATLFSGKFPNIVSELLNEDLSLSYTGFIIDPLKGWKNSNI